MKKLLFALPLVIAGFSAAYAQSKQDFQLINKTGYEIKEVYVSTSKTNNWEEDVLDDQTLEDGETLNVKFSGVGKSCLWDIKVVYAEDDSSAIWHDIDLCKVERVTIHYNRKADETTATFD